MFGSKKKKESEYQRIMEGFNREKQIAQAYLGQLRRKDRKYNFHLIPLAGFSGKFMPFSSYASSDSISFEWIKLNGQGVNFGHKDKLSLSLKPGKYKLEVGVKIDRSLGQEEYAALREQYPNVEAKVNDRRLKYQCERTCNFVVNDTDDCYVLYKVTVATHWKRYYNQERTDREYDRNGSVYYIKRRYHQSDLEDYKHSYELYQTSREVIASLCHYWDVDSVLYDYPSVEQQYIDACLQTYGAELCQYKDAEPKPIAPKPTPTPPKPAPAPAPKPAPSAWSSSTSTSSGGWAYQTVPKATATPSAPPKPAPAPKAEPPKKPASSNVHILPNGDKYYGTLKDGKFEGKGKYYYRQKGCDGDRYEGDFHNGMRHGKGKYVYKNGDLYRGEFQNDQMTGIGKLYFANGNIGYYEGSFKNGKYDGEGYFHYNDDTPLFKGTFKDGKRHGKGSYIFSYSHRYTCEYQNDQPVGDYECQMSNGDVYVGQIKNFKYHGKGKLTQGSSKYVYDGEFKNGEYDGFGILYDQNRNKVYEGTYQNGKYHGKGTEILKTSRYEGDFVNGKREGYGHYWLGDSEYEGEFRNDDPHGYGKWSYFDKSTYEGNLVNGKCHGKGVYTYPNGDRYEGAFVDGKKTGIGTMYFANGNRYEGEFKNEKFHGKGTFFYVNGNRLEGSCVEGNWQGRALLFRIDGSIEEQIYENNVMVSQKPLEERSPSRLYQFRTVAGLNYSNVVYVGEVDGQTPEGYGFLIDPHGEYLFVGQFQKGTAHGFGLYLGVKSQCVRAGQFEGLTLNGYGVELPPDRTATFGRFENGVVKELVGMDVLFDYPFAPVNLNYNIQLTPCVGRTVFGPMLNNSLHYAGVVCFDSDVRIVGQYANGWETGFGVYTYPDGSFYVGTFANGAFHGCGMMVKNGSCKFGKWENNLFIG